MFSTTNCSDLQGSHERFSGHKGFLARVVTVRTYFEEICRLKPTGIEY